MSLGRSLLQITHTGSDSFLVGVFDDGEYSILVNDVGPFDDTRSIAASEAVMFDVLANGDWSITLLPMQ